MQRKRVKQVFLVSGLTIGSILCGILIAIFIFQGSLRALTSVKAFSEQLSILGDKIRGIDNDVLGENFTQENEQSESNLSPVEIALGNISDGMYSPPETGKVIRINLESMELTQYEDGKIIKTIPVLSKGKTGSYWETPGGKYSVLYKEESHLSSFGKVWMPWSMQFFGNYFIHGWPTDKAGKPLADIGYSGGCIRLDTKDAEALYAWTDIGTTVSIYNTKSEEPASVGESSPYFLKNPKLQPKITADAYIVGDVSSGDIILEKNMDAVHPIASVSKLMTALTALDVVHQRGTSTVSKKALSTYGENGGFYVGEKIKNSDLLYPLLLESSNDSAEIIAEQVGRNYFLRSMNAKASSIGLIQTNFDDPSGLSENNISTARDLFKMARYIHEFKHYVYDITKLEKYSNGVHTWVNTNRYLGEENYAGGKTGYTNPAKETIVALFDVPISEFENRTIAIILLQSTDRYRDTNELLSYLRKNVYRGANGPVEIVENKEEPSKKVTLAFGGDVMLDRGVKSSVDRNFAGDYSRLFEKLTPLKDADISFVNLEGPVSNTGNNVGSKYSFRMDPKVLDVMRYAGIDIVSFANNHVGDWNKSAFNDTLSRLKQAGIKYTGAGTNKAVAIEPTIIEKNGLKIGFLGFSDVGPDWVKATDSSSGILIASDPDFENIIKNANQKVDILVVSFHWGVEYARHNTRQQTLAYKAIENGAELVVGHHPHVIQDTEEYKGALIMYSLGNLIFDQYFSEETMQGLIVETKFSGDKIESYDKKLVKLNSYFQPEEILDYP